MNPTSIIEIFDAPVYWKSKTKLMAMADKWKKQSDTLHNCCSITEAFMQCDKRGVSSVCTIDLPKARGYIDKIFGSKYKDCNAELMKVGLHVESEKHHLIKGGISMMYVELKTISTTNENRMSDS